MSRWSKNSKIPTPAGAGAVAGEVAVQKVEKIEFHNIIHIKPPVPSNPRKPDSPSDDINWRAGRFIEDTKKRWSLGDKPFRATGGR